MQEEISKKNNFVLSLPALCNVFENMNENEYKAKSTHLPSTFRYQTFIENVLTLKNLWKTHIVDNDDEKISSEKMQLTVECSFEMCFKGNGFTISRYWEEICRKCSATSERR